MSAATGKKLFAVTSCMALAMAIAAAAPATGIRDFRGKGVPTEHIDREAKRTMAEAGVQGLAMAVTDNGRVAFVRSSVECTASQGHPHGGEG